MIFVAQKSITCLKLWQTVRDEFAMHARTLRHHANVSQQFATVLQIYSSCDRVFSSVYRHVECNISVSCKANAVLNQFGALRYNDLKV